MEQRGVAASEATRRRDTIEPMTASRGYLSIHCLLVLVNRRVDNVAHSSVEHRNWWMGCVGVRGSEGIAKRNVEGTMVVQSE